MQFSCFQRLLCWLGGLLPTDVPEPGLASAVPLPCPPAHSVKLSLTAAHPLTQSHVVPAGAWAKVLRRSWADYAALALPFNMKITAGFQYQMPVVDLRSRNAITFVLENDPPCSAWAATFPASLS